MRWTSPVDPDVVEDVDAHRYEIVVDGRVAGIAAYVERPGGRVFTHTEVADGFAGRGLGSRLVRAAMEDASRRGLDVVPQCWFVAGYIERHPEYRALVEGPGGADATP